jgi:hypothetical protein
VETDSGGGTGSGVVFNIQIGGSGDDPKDKGHGRVSKSKKGVSVTIPTTKNKDGTYTVSDG